MNHDRLILASDSPRRKELLELAGIDLEVQPTPVDETLEPGESASAHVLRLARAKADWSANHNPDSWILAADTIVVLNERIMGKPRDKAEAGDMLKSLSGRRHNVLTGYCLLNRKLQQCESDYVCTGVEFRELSSSDINIYLDSNEPIGKAGAYAIQGRGAALVRGINGSYTNVVGLPLVEIIELLKRFELIP
ncbi:MAG: septum formation inhibitor Maf [Deltaproteobacteria bacterium]|nr:septum formation inhibitor Maf [Deltaproteobacteria bacterium]MBW2050722.1 septum formation inhibitor Maf [Deltaproteobacteria bacterium]MBW2139785.1 septum formation inhibitor Maf [Deltaproteobacteria bacterium]MBW2322773.1 septum formation inhibitor Maf [Deltaproteobacteria bacterium]